MLNKSGESEHPCLVPYVRGNAFICSPLSMVLVVSLLHMVFIMSRYVPSLSNLWRFYFLIINWCWILSKAFSAIIEMLTWFLFSVLIWCNTLIGLCPFKNPCIPGINSTSSWCMIICVVEFCLLVFC